MSSQQIRDDYLVEFKAGAKAVLPEDMRVVRVYDRSRESPGAYICVLTTPLADTPHLWVSGGLTDPSPERWREQGEFCGKAAADWLSRRIEQNRAA